MSTTDELRKQLNSRLEDARRLRDELRQKLQQGTADARKRYKEEYEPQLQKIEKEITEIGEGAMRRASEMLDETRTAFRNMFGDLKRKAEPEAEADSADEKATAGAETIDDG